MTVSTWLPGQYAPGNSFIHSADVRAKLGAAFILATGAALAHSLEGYVAMVGGLALVYIATGLPFWRLLVQLRPFLFFAIAAFLMGEGIGGQPIVQVGTWQYTTADAAAGAATACRMLLLIGAALWLSLTSSPTQLVNGLSALLSPLRKLRIPTDGLIIAIWIALRFLPVLTGDTMRIKRAQTARGIDYARGVPGMWRRLSSFVVPLLAATLRRADFMADALVARGYRAGSLEREIDGRLCAGDWALVVGAVGVTAVAVLC